MGFHIHCRPHRKTGSGSHLQNGGRCSWLTARHESSKEGRQTRVPLPAPAAGEDAPGRGYRQSGHDEGCVASRGGLSPSSGFGPSSVHSEKLGDGPALRFEGVTARGWARRGSSVSRFTRGQRECPSSQGWPGPREGLHWVRQRPARTRRGIPRRPPHTGFQLPAGPHPPPAPRGLPAPSPPRLPHQGARAC